MKKVVIQILIVWMNFVILSSLPALATEENAVQNETTNTSTQETKVEEKPTETKKNETMYVQERCNIRASYSVDSDRVGGLDVGTEVTVVAEYSNGWYKINHDGKEAYIKAGILRSTKPEVEEEVPEEEKQEETPENTVEPSQTAENVTDGSQDEVSIEDAEMINEIGVLPEVGKNIADVFLIGVIVLAIGLMFYVKKRENF